MKPQFTAEFFRQNREKLRTLFTGKAPVVLTANGILQRNSDNEYKFRQDSSFWYLTGITDPEVILVLDKNKEYLILPTRDEVIAAFYGELITQALTERSGIETILDEKTGWKQLTHRLKKVQHVATLAPPPAFVERVGLYTNPARARLVSRIKEINPEAELLDLRPHLLRMRVIKQEIEVAMLRTAIDITIDTIKTIERKLPKYEYEYEIEADLTQGFRKRGAQDHAFTPIVASGKNTCTIHYYTNEDSLKDKSLLYLDVGAEYNYYTADIARTYFLKDPSKREQKVFDAVDEVRKFATETMKPGLVLKDYEAGVDQFMGEKLRELGLIKSIERDQVRKFFPHHVTHSIGLDPHDVLDYEKPIEPGMALTVEPGIYIPDEGIGIRIEDDVLITAEGPEVLTKRLPNLVK